MAVITYFVTKRCPDKYKTIAATATTNEKCQLPIHFKVTKKYHLSEDRLMLFSFVCGLLVFSEDAFHFMKREEHEKFEK